MKLTHRKKHDSKHEDIPKKSKYTDNEWKTQVIKESSPDKDN